MSTDDPKQKNPLKPSKAIPVPDFFPPEIRQAVAGKKLKVTIPPIVKSRLKGDFPASVFLPDGADKVAWEKVKEYFLTFYGQTKNELAWEIIFIIRPYMERFQKAKSLLPPSKRLSKIKQVCRAITRQQEILHELCEETLNDFFPFFIQASKSLSEANEALIKTMHLHNDKRPTENKNIHERRTVKIRIKFIKNTYILLKSNIPSFEIPCEDPAKYPEYQLLCNICLTAGILKQKNEFPDSILKELAAITVPSPK